MSSSAFSPELLVALRDGTRLLSVVAYSGDNKNYLSAQTNDVPAIVQAFAGYVVAAQGWKSARIVVAAIMADDTQRTFLDMVGTRRRLTPAGSMVLVWREGPDHPKGGAP